MHFFQTIETDAINYTQLRDGDQYFAVNKPMHQDQLAPFDINKAVIVQSVPTADVHIDYAQVPVTLPHNLHVLQSVPETTFVTEQNLSTEESSTFETENKIHHEDKTIPVGVEASQTENGTALKDDLDNSKDHQVAQLVNLNNHQVTPLDKEATYEDEDIESGASVIDGDESEFEKDKNDSDYDEESDSDDTDNESGDEAGHTKRSNKKSTKTKQVIEQTGEQAVNEEKENTDSSEINKSLDTTNNKSLDTTGESIVKSTHDDNQEPIKKVGKRTKLRSDIIAGGVKFIDDKDSEDVNEENTPSRSKRKAYKQSYAFEDSDEEVEAKPLSKIMPRKPRKPAKPMRKGVERKEEIDGEWDIPEKKLKAEEDLLEISNTKKEQKERKQQKKREKKEKRKKKMKKSNDTVDVLNDIDIISKYENDFLSSKLTTVSTTGSYSCEPCNLKFKKMRDLRKHVEASPQCNPNRCQVCKLFNPYILLKFIQKQ